MAALALSSAMHSTACLSLVLSVNDTSRLSQLPCGPALSDRPIIEPCMHTAGLCQSAVSVGDCSDS